jgi:hypothetical protein
MPQAKPSGHPRPACDLSDGFFQVALLKRKLTKTLLTQKQPDIPAHGFLVAVEVANEQVEFSIVVPV